MPETVIVQGAAGFVGRHLAARLHNSGYEVIALTRSPIDLAAGVELQIGNFDTPESYTHLLRQANIFIHAASGSTPGSTAGKPLSEIDTNLRPTLALLEALQQAPHCRLIYLSSGGTLYGDTHDQAADENHPLQTRSYYGAGKAAAEYFIQAACQQYGLTSIALRPSNLYGPGQGLRRGFGIIPAAFAHLLSGKPLTLWGDGQTVRDYLYIDDFINLCCQLIRQPLPMGAISFNVASGQSVSLLQLTEKIQQITGKKLSVIHDMSRSVDIEKIELNADRIRQQFNWQAETKLEQGLEKTWLWWQSQ